MTLRPVTSMVILWTDGVTDTFPFNRSEVKNGELHIWTYYPGNRKRPPERRDEHFFPLCNIRARTVSEDRPGDGPAREGDGTAPGGELCVAAPFLALSGNCVRRRLPVYGIHSCALAARKARRSRRPKLRSSN